MKIAIQGVQGSFYSLATKRYFGNDLEIIEKSTFSEVFDSLTNDECDIACVAIENAIYGSIYENYDLLQKHNFHIIGEIFLKINHNVMALPGQSMESIKRIISHPVALKQCQKILQPLHKKGVHIEEHEDTAGAAKEIKENNLRETAAIASIEAAHMYGLEILAPSIQDQENNYTRFLFLSKTPKETDFDKISLNFHIKNQPGSLLNALTIIAQHKGNMTKLESRPILGQVWEYQFYVDIVMSSQLVKPLLTELKEYTDNLKVLGQYTQGEFVE